MNDFNSMKLPEAILHSLKAMQFDEATPIQAQTIPSALEGHDILGSAQTGTGKTAAYGIPLVNYLLKSEANATLILVPTRELAIQVLDTLRKILGKISIVKTCLLIGGASMSPQLKQLQSRPQVIVGTPGRVNDHLKRKSLSLKNVGFFVLDEIDRMLDIGFSVQIQKIAQHLPEKRQTMMFSATINNNIVKLAQEYLKDPIRVSVGSSTQAVPQIKQEIIRTSDPEKYDILLKQLEAIPGLFVIFVKTKYATEKLADKLCKNGHEAEAIHGDLRQNRREKVIRSFRTGKHRILVATDVAARGLDIPEIQCVVNYDLPQCPEDYIHRIGRTGRAGAEGTAVSLLTSQDNIKWRNICKLMNPDQKFENEKPTRNGDKRTRDYTKPGKKSSWQKQSKFKRNRPGQAGDSKNNGNAKPFSKARRPNRTGKKIA